jgi:hypothetical protein
MERIVLEVDGASARAWRNTSPAIRAEYETKIATLLGELKEAEFDKLLDRVGKTAEQNGLTEEKLNELLNEPD